MKTLRNPIVHIANRASAQVDKPLCSVGIFNMENQEEWRPVVGYEGYYEVSNFGNLKSLERMRINKHGVRAFKPSLVMRPYPDGAGYLYANLSKDGVYHRKKIHHLVAEAFLNHVVTKSGLVVDHINNIKIDNRSCNLQIITRSLNNSKDSKRVSKFRWVSFESKTKKWRFSLSIGSVKIKSARFDDEGLAFDWGKQRMIEENLESYL